MFCLSVFKWIQDDQNKMTYPSSFYTRWTNRQTTCPSRRFVRRLVWKQPFIQIRPLRKLNCFVQGFPEAQFFRSLISRPPPSGRAGRSEGWLLERRLVVSSPVGSPISSPTPPSSWVSGIAIQLSNCFQTENSGLPVLLRLPGELIFIVLTMTNRKKKSTFYGSQKEYEKQKVAKVKVPIKGKKKDNGITIFICLINPLKLLSWKLFLCVKRNLKWRWKIPSTFY